MQSAKSDVFTDYAERKRLYAKIDALEAELKAARKDAEYYRTQLNITRVKLIKLHNLSGAVSRVPENETVDHSWLRCIEEIECGIKRLSTKRD